MTTSSEQQLQELNHRLDKKVQQLEALIDLGRVLAGVVEPDEVARRLGLTLAGQWALRAYAVTAFRDGRIPIVRQKGMPELETAPFEPAVAEIASWKSPFLLASIHADNDSPLVQLLRRSTVEAIVPLISGETTVGFAALGRRAGGLKFTEDDLAHAAGLAGQAVVALEGSWQSQDSSRWRLISEAGAEWRQLDRLSRLVFAAVVRLGYEKAQTQEEFVAALLATLSQPGFEMRADRIAVAIDRLLVRGALSRDENGVLRVEKPSWLSLPELRKPLAEIARESTERIGAYEIVERIGGGGMGEVFRAINVHDGSSAALKLLAPSDRGNDDARKRLEREGAIVATISHANIVRLIERGEHEGRLYLAMELIQGETLTAHLRRSPMDAVTAYRSAIELASALDAFHSRGVIHRDIKSSNIMRTPEGRLVLLDFGLARGLDSATLTRTSEVMGSLPYMAPEQLRGELTDARTDVWGFGIVLYEMLTGRLPWKAADTVRLAIEILSSAPAVVDTLTPIVGEPFAQFVQDTLTPTAASRISDGAMLLRKLYAIEVKPGDPGLGETLERAVALHDDITTTLPKEPRNQEPPLKTPR